VLIRKNQLSVFFTRGCTVKHFDAISVAVS
jgi:hypothetical protein